MATTSADTGGRINLVASNRPRRPLHPARKRMVLPVALVILGSFMPWLFVGGISVSGAGGPGLWTFYAAMLGLAAALMPWHRAGAVCALIMAATAISIPIWQLAHVISLVGFAGWMPGPGIVLVAFGGVLAVRLAIKLVREPAVT